MHLDKILHFDPSELNPKTGQFGVAWVLTKLTEPLRLLVAVAITPRIARLLGRVPKDEKFSESLAKHVGLPCTLPRITWDDLSGLNAMKAKEKAAKHGASA